LDFDLKPPEKLRHYLMDFKVFKGLGIPYGQGWYFYKAMPLEEALEKFSS